MNKTPRFAPTGYLFAFLALALLSGCSLLGRGLVSEERAAESMRAQQVIDRLAHVNSELVAFKGIGRIKIQGQSPDSMSINERAAWVAERPHNLSLVILSSGRPVFKMATDGRHLYLVDLTNPGQSYRKLRSADAGFERLISLPLKPSDVVAFLAGRIPIAEYSAAQFTKSDADDRYVLTLKNWWQVVQKVYLDDAGSRVREVEYFGYDGKLRYRVQFESMQEVKGYLVPVRVLISDDSGIGVQIDIDRFIADAPVTPSMFVLSPPQI